MFWLTWQMALLLAVSFAGGIFTGYRIWSGEGRGADEAIADVARLRRENENLARRLGESEARVGAAEMRSDAPSKTGHADPLPVSDPEPVAVEVETEDAPADDKPAGKADDEDLSRIKGLGPKALAALREGGVTRVSQIAAWSESDIADWDARINGRGRITRDNWVGQAKDLA